tara:strand:- start:13 stop:192 length:180 start_codon:yes stop_codon:yes gene_type:complete
MLTDFKVIELTTVKLLLNADVLFQGPLLEELAAGVEGPTVWAWVENIGMKKAIPRNRIV